VVSGGSVKIPSSSSAFSPLIVISFFDTIKLKFDVIKTKAFTLDTGNSDNYSVDKLTVFHRKV
jgi:hypothetical protein